MYKVEDLPSQTGKTIIVTGANAGLGYQTALALASKQATVILACRSEEKAQRAMQKIASQVTGADLHFISLDLTDLASVKSFAAEFLRRFSRLDVLINNAGVMIPPYTQTEDGFELQMGANYFGHFLLTGLLLERLQNTEGARVVSLSSLAHLNARINIEDIHWQKSYSKMRAYQQSKLACLMFALELQRRFERVAATTISVAAHPGISTTELSRHIPRLAYLAFLPVVKLVSHPPRRGMLPILMAATMDGVQGGEYYGPTGFREMIGEPGVAKIAHRARSEERAKQLWQLSEQLTGFSYPI